MEASSDDVRFMSKPFDGLVNFFSQFGKGLATKVAKFYVFQMVPYPFIRIKFRVITEKKEKPNDLKNLEKSLDDDDSKKGESGEQSDLPDDGNS